MYCFQISLRGPFGTVTIFVFFMSGNVVTGGSFPYSNRQGRGFYPFGCGIIFLILTHSVYKM
jgi:hypothetical protein